MDILLLLYETLGLFGVSVTWKNNPPIYSTHFLTLSEAWDLEQETNMARASEKWRTCVELQLYSDFTDCIERQHRGFNG